MPKPIHSKNSSPKKYDADKPSIDNVSWLSRAINYFHEKLTCEWSMTEEGQI